MNQRTSKIFIEDILQAINKIERFTGELKFKDFEQNELVIDGVLRNLEVIGEASRHIPETIRLKYTDIPWQRMVGFRNFLIHAYFNVDLTIVWQVVQVNLPETKAFIEAMLADM